MCACQKVRLPDFHGKGLAPVQLANSTILDLPIYYLYLLIPAVLPMIQYALYQADVPEALRSQVVIMASHYATDLAMDRCPTDHPHYGMTQALLSIEVDAYVDAIGYTGMNGELLVAYDEVNCPGSLLGFLLYMPLSGTTGRCGVNYGAVHEDFRRKGIFTGLMLRMLARYPGASLSCFVESVPLYEHLGFKIELARDTQVQMTTETSPDEEATMPVIDISGCGSHPAVLKARGEALRHFGLPAVEEALIQREQHLNAMRHQVASFVATRLSGATL